MNLDVVYIEIVWFVIWLAPISGWFCSEKARIERSLFVEVGFTNNPNLKIIEKYESESPETKMVEKKD